MPRALAICALLALALPGRAAAEWHFSPSIGFTFAKEANFFFETEAMERRNRNFGMTVSRLGAGIFGVEGTVTWTPTFFEGQSVEADQEGSNRALTMMGNVVLTTPRLWTEYSLRPFVSAGVGLMHLRATDELIFPLSADFTGFNIGVGAIGFLSDRTGVRFETRYYSTLGRKEVDPLITNDGGPFHLRYMTASIAFVIRTGVR